MSWSISFNEQKQFIELVLADTNSGQDIRDATKEGVALSKARGVSRFLVDASKMHITASLADILDLPNRQYFDEGLDRNSRVAVVNPESDRSKEATQFYETASVNRGWQVRTFSDRSDAEDWLTAAGSAEESP